MDENFGLDFVVDFHYTISPFQPYCEGSWGKTDLKKIGNNQVKAVFPNSLKSRPHFEIYT